MKNQPESPKGVIYAETLPPSLKNICLVLEFREEGLVMELSREGAVLATVRVPSELAAHDLPYWISSYLRTCRPDFDTNALNAYESGLQRQFPSRRGLLSICIGPKAKFHECSVFHVAYDHVDVVQHGTLISLTSSITDSRYVPESESLKWTFIFKTSTEVDAQTVEARLLPSNFSGHIVSLDGEITGVLAFNATRWEAAGFSVWEVNKLAAQRNLSLRQVGRTNSSLSFRVNGG